MLYGARVSLTIPLAVEFGVILFGVPIGLIAGYFGGLIDDVIMRFTDIMYAFPGLLLVIIMVSVFGRSVWIICMSLAIGNIPTLIRIVRGQVLQVRQMDYVLSAYSIGTRSTGIMSRHIFPNILGSIIVLVTLDFPADIIAEASLTFIGLGVDPSTPTWGTLINAAYPAIQAYPFETIVPAAAIAFLTLSLSFIGDGVRDAFDPRITR
jgi:oligopeptide transport system permease protein